MTLSDVQTPLHALIHSSTILLGRLLESDLHGLQISYLRCIGTAIPFYHPRGRPLKPGLTWLTREWLGRNIQDHGCGGHNLEEDACACIDLVKAEIKNRPRFGGFWAEYEPVMARIAQSRVTWARMVIVYPGSPGWDGRSATAPAMTVACANNAEVLDRLRGAPSRHELIFGGLMGLADALGYAMIPKAGADLPGAENAERKNRTGAAETKTEIAETPPPPRLQRSHDEPECEPDRATPSSLTVHGAAPFLEE